MQPRQPVYFRWRNTGERHRGILVLARASIRESRARTLALFLVAADDRQPVIGGRLLHVFGHRELRRLGRRDARPLTGLALARWTHTLGCGVVSAGGLAGAAGIAPVP